jgi:hypothetical protein
MVDSVSSLTAAAARRSKFRAFMQAFNPTAPAQAAIEAGLICEDLHRSLYQNLGARADLEAGSLQLLVGGIGSGKTTELLLAVKWLREHADVLPLYIDITTETDLSGLNVGSLLASFGTHLSSRLQKAPNFVRERKAELKETFQKIREFAFGRVERIWVSYDQDEGEPDFEDESTEEGYFTFQKLPGKLKPPLPALRRDLSQIVEPLKKLLEAARVYCKDVIVVLDGLDRLLVPEKFLAVAFQDFRVFRSLKVSVLSTAPISILYGVGNSVPEYFDRVQHVPALIAGPKDDLLRSVIQKRGGLNLMGVEEADSLCKFSGGVLRDLISLARDAAEEAYISGHQSITAEDTAKVVQQLGASYMRGLSPESIKALLAMEKSKEFDVSKPANIEFLVTRRVLEYSTNNFRPHPALLSAILAPEEPNA